MSASSKKTFGIALTAMLSALAFVLMFVEFPVPIMPAFIKFDVSDLPAVFGAFVLGPFYGVLIELIKNLLQLISSSTGGIGELANFLIGASYVATAGWIYQRNKTKKTAWIAGIAGSIVMGIVAALANYYILLPLFEQFLPVDQLIASFSEFMPFIKTKADVVLFNALPFNLLKGLAISAFCMLVYKRLSPILKGTKTGGAVHVRA